MSQVAEIQFQLSILNQLGGENLRQKISEWCSGSSAEHENTGAGDSEVMVTFEPGLTIESRRTAKILLPARPQRETRRAGGTTAERRATDCVVAFGVTTITLVGRVHLCRPPLMTDYQIAAPSMYGPGGQDTLFNSIPPNFGDFPDFDLSFLDALGPLPSNDASYGFQFPQYDFGATHNSMDINFSFFQHPDSGSQFSVPPSPSASLPRLPLTPTSSSIYPTPEPVTAQVDQVSVTSSKQRKSRDDVDPASVIHTTRARNAPKRAHA
ncbi:hypothetical protein FB451DRAFT_1188150 [Mycena latifolia]|nr:hypothetical protein FB451DRAFT_1188150 [Mycena latifolia]